MGIATAALAVWLGACSSSDATPLASSFAEAGPQTEAERCAVPNEACPCEQEGKVLACGQEAGRDLAGNITCMSGSRTCSAGRWSVCQPGAAVLQAQGPVIISPGACLMTDPCDPYCHRYADETADFKCPGTGGVSWTKKPSGPPPAEVSSLLQQGGNTSVGWYHELDPGDFAIDPKTIGVALNTVDVYFLLNGTDAMAGPITQLANGMVSTINSIKAKIPNVAFGVGRFNNYEAWPYGVQSHEGNTLYVNDQSVSTNQQLTIDKLNYLKNNAGSLFTQAPYAKAQASSVALYAMATNERLYGYGRFVMQNQADAWYNVFKYYGRVNDGNLWHSPFSYKTTAPWWGGGTCSGGKGAPCFRDDAYHLVVLVQDAPTMNGPAGSFPYYQMKPRYFSNLATADYTTANEWYWWYSPSFGATNHVPVLPPWLGTAQSQTIPQASVGSPVVYQGQLPDNAASNYSMTTAGAKQGATTYPWAADARSKCAIAAGTGGDIAFDFTLTEEGPFWADTVGTSYDTLLYLINLDDKTTVACMDDSFSYLSVDVGLSNVTSTDRQQGATNSAVVGNLPAGHYRLVVDRYASGSFPNVSQLDGMYQVNLWPNIDDPKYGGNPFETALSTPSYRQAMTALKSPGINAMVLGVESSGASCNQAPTSWEKAWTRWSLENLATDTGAIVNGSPAVYSVRQNGTPGCATGTCNAAQCPQSASFGDVVADAVVNITQNLAQTITASAADDDDLTDFDGPPNGAVKLTSSNVDDATFVASITAKPAAGCTGPSGNKYDSCLPGAQPNFEFKFGVPPGVTQLPDKPQIFQFKIQIRGANGVLLSEQPVTIVVPPKSDPYDPVDYEREFHATDVCPAGSKIVWGLYSWDTSTPDTTKIEFTVKVADTAAGLDTATEISTPLAVAKLSPDTQKGTANLNSFLQAQGAKPNSKFVRIRGHLTPSSLSTPVIHGWSLEMDCLPP